MSPSDRVRLLEALEESYRAVKRSTRDVRASDRLREDLRIDSLSALEILLAVEDRLGMEIVDDPRVRTVETVEDLVDVLEDLSAAAR